jgi:quinol monooxygenase YgiN
VFCVVVRFEVKAGFEAQFRQKVLENAAASRANEPGCRVFDVCEGERAGDILLYELYDSERAFRDHLGTSHFKRFDAETAHWISEKRVATYRRLAA